MALSGLKSRTQPPQRAAKKGSAGADTARSQPRRSPRKQHTVNVRTSDAQPSGGEDTQAQRKGKAAGSRAAARDAASREELPAGPCSQRNSRAAAWNNRTVPAKQQQRPQRQLRSHSTRAARKAGKGKQEAVLSSEESSEEECEPETATAQKANRKASKLIQGGGGISSDDEEASGRPDRSRTNLGLINFKLKQPAFSHREYEKRGARIYYRMMSVGRWTSAGSWGPGRLMLVP